MTQIIKNLPLPVDEDGFLRRECPYCKRQFKLHQDEFGSLQDESDHYCPYCGQIANSGQWGTEEQAEHINTNLDNIVADLLNENLINPLQHSFSHSNNIEFTGKEIEKKNQIIQPETNDMKTIILACCQKRVKIIDEWDKGVKCYYCGFQHTIHN